MYYLILLPHLFSSICKLSSYSRTRCCYLLLFFSIYTVQYLLIWCLYFIVCFLMWTYVLPWNCPSYFRSVWVSRTSWILCWFLMVLLYVRVHFGFWLSTTVVTGSKSFLLLIWRGITPHRGGAVITTTIITTFQDVSFSYRHDDDILHYDWHYMTLNPRNLTQYTGSPHPFGMDPIWMIASNKITYTNSYKMKMSIIIGVCQMLFGLMLSICNHMWVY